MGSPDALPESWLKSSVAKLFAAAGLSAAAARTVASSLVEADMRGVSSHGVMLVPMYLARLRAGSVSTRERAEVVVDSGAIAVLDAGNALGQLTGDQAIALAIERARRFGIGAVAVRRAFHFGSAARYALRAADEQCIGIAAANTRPLMPAPGGARAVVGNNPLAIAAPAAAGDDPVVVDMALSEAALGKIRLAERDGREIPPTWATDAEGRPTTDPSAALAGMLLPSGLHKGFGLAVMIDVLSGVLSGGSWGAQVKPLYADVGAPNDCAHFFAAIEIAAFEEIDRFRERVAAMCAAIRDSPRAPDIERLYVPGEIEARRRARAAAEGVALDRGTLTALREEAARLGVQLGEPATKETLGDGR